MKSWGGSILNWMMHCWVMDDIAEAMYMKGAADRELMIR